VLLFEGLSFYPKTWHTGFLAMPLNVEKKVSRSRKITVLSATLLLTIIGFAALLAGVAFGVLNQTATDADGYYLSEPYQVSTSTYVFMFPMMPAYDSGDPGVAKWVVASANPVKELFVGWGSTVNTGSYLDGVAFETPYPAWEWNYGLYWASITVGETGTWNSNPPAVLPSDESFWIDSVQTSGSATIPIEIHWDNTTSGNRALLIMNADGTANVQADVQFGAKIPMLSWLPFILVPVGFVLAFIGLALFRRRAKYYTPHQSAT
jgi:uncharacterized membrane protein